MSLQGNKTALHFASESGQDKVCQVMLDAGADVRAKSTWVSNTILIDIIFNDVDNNDDDEHYLI